MRIGVLSDTHRYINVIPKVIEVFHNPDLIIHLGDNVDDVNAIKSLYSGKLINVRGNCDFSVGVEDELLKNIGGKRFFITHGHKYDVKYSLSMLKNRAQQLHADIVLFGHTHVSQIIHDNGILFVNPGSPSLSRGASNSVAVIDIENESINANIECV